MKILASIIALNLAAAFATPVVAAELPTNKADCEQAGMKWKEQANQNKCRFADRSEHRLPAPVHNVLGIIGIGANLLCLIMLYREWRT
jgi:hypothetical protein